MADQRLLESGDLRLLESGDVRLLEDAGAVGAGANTITVTAPSVGVGVAAGANTVTLSAPAVLLGVSAGAQTIAIEAPAATAGGLLHYVDIVTIARRLEGSAFRFRDQVRIVHTPLPVFGDTVTIRRNLIPFRDRVRVVPDVASLFAENIQRPVGRIVED